MASGSASQKWRGWSSARGRRAEHEHQRGGKGRARHNSCPGTFRAKGMIGAYIVTMYFHVGFSQICDEMVETSDQESRDV